MITKKFRSALIVALAVLTATTALALTLKLIAALDLVFEPGNDAIDAEQMVRLEKLLRTPAAQPCELEMMIVVGHADVAEAAFNELHGLSCRRANRVKDQLVRLGIPLDRIFVEGFGARQLVDEVGSTRNRRVEIEAVGMINSCRFRRNEASSTAGSTCMDVP